MELIKMKFGIQQVIASGVITLLSLGSAQAVPLYYTFEGSISPYNMMDNANVMEDVGLSAGDAVSLTLMIDRDKQGYFEELAVGSTGGNVAGHKDNPPSGEGTYIFHEVFDVELVEFSVFDLVQGLYQDLLGYAIDSEIEVTIGLAPVAGASHFYIVGFTMEVDIELRGCGDAYLWAVISTL
jgi:hypothetical protein